jgi:hypothetical protein
MKLRPAASCLAAGIFFLAGAGSSSAQAPLDETHFRLRIGDGGIVGLKRPGDAFDTEYIAPGKTLGHVFLRYRMEGGLWQAVSTPSMADRAARIVPASSERVERSFTFFDKYYLYEGDFNDHYADLETTVRFRLEGDALVWTIRLRNLTGRPVTVGDLAFPLPMNTSAWWSKEDMYTKRLVPHPFIGGHGSFVFWMRPNGIGPFLVMTPLAAPPAFERKEGFRPGKLEYADERAFYIHSEATVSEEIEAGGNWRLPPTSLVLAPGPGPASEAAYGFKLRWAVGYDEVRNILVEEGLWDVQAVPGMTVPTDLEALVAVRSKSPIASIRAEFPDKTRLEDLGERTPGTRLYRVRFGRLGENRLTVRAADGRELPLEFFATEPLETLIKKRATHLVEYQQHRDPSKWYNGLFSDWDMRAKVLRGPDDTDGLKDFWVASDDPGLCKAPYVAAKNASFPVAREIEAVEYYIKNTLWGGLQQTDREPYPYGIFGIPNWKKHRESLSSDRDGWTGHLWRLADYPHVIVLYLNMARIAGMYPGTTHYLDRRGYLERAHGTAMAFFSVPLATGGWSAIELPRMNEMIIPSLIEELRAEGMTSQADGLRRLWEKKVAHYVNDGPNLLHAEYPGNPCAFESAQAFARYALERAGRPGSSLPVKPEDAARFTEEQMRLNIALRGWIEPGYSLLGISKPGSGFYMSHMGGWAVMDYALGFVRDPIPYLRLGYASYLGNWALENSGTDESGYGYWFPGRENDGAAAGAYVGVAYGEVQGKAVGRGAWFYGGEVDMGFGAALRTAATVVADDPIFGRLAYGGTLKESGDWTEVVPRDGLRQRFHILRGTARVRLGLDRDGFAADMPVRFRESLEEYDFVLENRTGDAHRTRLTLSGLAPGSYEIAMDGRAIGRFSAKAADETVVALPLKERDPRPIVTIRRAR